MVFPRVNVPSSCASRKTAAISSRASVFQLNPPVSTSTTTGRKPRKRSQIAKGFIGWTLSDRIVDCRAAKFLCVCGIGELPVQDQIHRETNAEARDVRGYRSKSSFAFRSAQVDMYPWYVGAY